MKQQETILVAIHCLVYNHEPYLRDCFEGFVMQQTDFPFVVIVHDDASTDGSKEIIREYECRYPHIFKPIYQKENLYKKGGFGAINEVMYSAIIATGAKYVAMCEGDDYWTDPLKLQKQVDFLEANPEYSLCFTNTMVKFKDDDVTAINHIWDTYTIEDIINTNALNTKSRGDNVVSCGHTSTVLYRIPADPLPLWISKCFIGDEPLFIALAEFGKAKFINVTTSVYRAGVGVSSRNFNEEDDWKSRIKMYEIINEGLEFKYKAIINSIIADFYLKLVKRSWKNGRKMEAIQYLCNSIRTDYRILIQWINKK